jgi:hypothetical protein
MQAEDYVLHLGALASALNTDDQHQEALGVANTCLQFAFADLSCLFDQANSLSFLGRLREAKSVIERALMVGAVTDLDAGAKRNLQNLFVQVNAALNEREPAGVEGGAIEHYQEARTGSARVTGGISCDGDAVGITINIDGDIDVSTIESVRKLFQRYHETALKVSS